MPKFSNKSKKKLATCDIRLQNIFNAIIKEHDCTIICGYRGKNEQNEAFNSGKSNAKFGQSKHNVTPSLAVDVAPYPIDWNDTLAFVMFATRVFIEAQKQNVKIRWGGHFKSTFDAPHYEILED